MKIELVDIDNALKYYQINDINYKNKCYKCIEDINTIEDFNIKTEEIYNILKLRPEKVIYISCNPATMVRDINMMEGEYQIKEIQPVDMFPYTSHVECCSVLYLKNSIQ